MTYHIVGAAALRLADDTAMMMHVIVTTVAAISMSVCLCRVVGGLSW